MKKFTLQDRLDKAAADRRLAAGLPSENPMPTTTPTTTPTTATTTAPAPVPEPSAIDLRETSWPADTGFAPEPGSTTERGIPVADALPNRRDGGGGLPVWQGADQPAPGTAWQLTSGGTTLTALNTRAHPSVDEALPMPAASATQTETETHPETHPETQGETQGANDEPRPSTAPLKDRCPNCRGAVRLDMFDLVEAVAHMSCVDCGFLYTTKSPKL